MAIEKPLFPSIDHKKSAEEEQWLSFFPYDAKKPAEHA
jgi:hypothetical protein